jgi:uncharacterized protein
MHQPVRWHEWGDEAFEIAKQENKPILLDIGAVWCHWCHVMDRESYEDPEVAQILNERFVAIKVDRDERPDIDSRYQVAVQAISGQGGWPLTAFLTPNGRPFYGGTYFPPQDHYGRPSFRRVLLAISDAHREKNGDVEEQAKLVEGAIAHSESFAGKRNSFDPEAVEKIIDSALRMFDEKNGGFGNAPKFPHPSILDLMLDRYSRTGDDRLRSVFSTTLEKMAQGGVYDQLAGGFHRYSVDERWIVPHFEKMAYDNSELLKNYVRAYQFTGADTFASVARDIIRWMDEWLSDRKHGGFYASQDADISLDDDGDYFTWTIQEARAVLTEEEAEVACLHYDINEAGEMHHNPAKNVLYQRASLEEIAARLKLAPARVREVLQSAKQKMYAARLKRATPYIDKTLYVNWNALCVSAYLLAGRVLHHEEARHFGLRSLDRILAEAWNSEHGLTHVIVYSDSRAVKKASPGYLDDYAFTALACLDAYETTSDMTYFRIARKLVDRMVANFCDVENGGFFDSQSSQASLGVLRTTRKPFQDSPTPAGNPAAAIALLRMHSYTEDAGYRERAEKTLELLAGAADQYGIFAATYGIAAVHFSTLHSQIVVVGEDQLASELYDQALLSQQFGRSVIRLTFSQAIGSNLPSALSSTIPQLPEVRNGRTTAIVCEEFRCLPPVHSVEELKSLLATSRKAA